MNEGELYRLPEVPVEEISVDEFEIVRAALYDSESDYRTIGSLYRQTGVAPEKVASVLANSDMARKSAVKLEGESLFAPADRPVPRREKILSFLGIVSQGGLPLIKR